MKKATVYLAGKDHGVNLYIPNIDDSLEEYEAIHDACAEAFPHEIMETIMGPEDTSLLEVLGEGDAEEAIQYLIEAIEHLGVETKVAQYLHSRGYDRPEDEE